VCRWNAAAHAGAAATASARTAWRGGAGVDGALLQNEMRLTCAFYTLSSTARGTFASSGTLPAQISSFPGTRRALLCAMASELCLRRSRTEESFAGLPHYGQNPVTLLASARQAPVGFYGGLESMDVNNLVRLFTYSIA
jgi:hypothetical protein